MLSWNVQIKTKGKKENEETKTMVGINENKTNLFNCNLHTQGEKKKREIKHPWSNTTLLKEEVFGEQERHFLIFCHEDVVSYWARLGKEPQEKRAKSRGKVSALCVDGLFLNHCSQYKTVTPSNSLFSGVQWLCLYIRVPRTILYEYNHDK